MSRIRGVDTGIERTLRSALHLVGLRFRKHASGLPGRPDVIFPKERIAIFVDGDFWHGYHFSSWKHRLTPYWQEKIERNRRRDIRNRRRLRAMGWTVIRVWGHDVERGLSRVTEAIRRQVLKKRALLNGRGTAINNRTV